MLIGYVTKKVVLGKSFHLFSVGHLVYNGVWWTRKKKVSSYNLTALKNVKYTCLKLGKVITTMHISK